MRSLRSIAWLAAAVGCGAWCLAAGQRPAAPVPAGAAAAPAKPGPTAATPGSIPPITLSPTVPAQPVFGSDGSLGGLQIDFDVFSWSSFIALNWPPGPDGNGDPTKQPGAGPTGDNATVWEGYEDAGAIFLPGGKAPAWGAPAEVPAVCRSQYRPGMRILSQIGKTPNLLTETVQPFQTGPLVDQLHGYARFEIVVNRSMFDYILSNSLYSVAGQQAFAGPVAFPCGAGSAVGAVMVKAAWKLVEKGDDLHRFHTATTLIYTPPSANPPVAESCATQSVELVGFHIAHKVNNFPQWIWSTFEQVDNVPTASQVKAGHLQAKYNFYDPTCPASTCKVNEAPPRPWIANQRSTPPSQVVREEVLPAFATASATQRNATAKALYLGVNPQSVWQYYELISTQWPTSPSPACAPNPTQPNGNPAPQFLANTTLETYDQGSVANVSSSCIGCHGNAGMTTGAASDFTYLLQRAQGKGKS
jgi:hypothetical protein